jgi:glycosyltransferase involved in cell wall biosynthesis
VTVLIAIYAHPEAYPPTLNAIMECARRAERVVVICRQTLPTNWEFPANVDLVYTTPLIDVADLGHVPAWRKAVHFMRFFQAIRRALRHYRVDLVIAYDAIPLLACGIARAEARGDFLLWYHNHDARSPADHEKFSVGWWAEMMEPRLFSQLDAFSLPALERRRFFPVQKVRGRVYHIPNYPPKHLYAGAKLDQTDVPDRNNRFGEVVQANASRDVDVVGEGGEMHDRGGSTSTGGRDRRGIPGDEIRMIYQGSIGPHHGFEELFPYLSRRVGGRRLKLTLMGKAWPSYREHLGELVSRHGIEDRVAFIDFRPYAEVCDVLRSHDVGLAIHKPVGVTYSTGGTASNKIYEYAAAGLPVILLDNQHYRSHLGEYEWTVFTNLGWTSFEACLVKILRCFGAMSEAARSDVWNELNFENVFWPVYEDVMANRRGGRVGEGE